MSIGDIKDENLYTLADLFKLFADSTRIRILYALLEKPLCVQELAKSLSMTQPAISHQLKILRQGHLISGKRAGKMMVYSLSDEHVSLILSKGLEHVLE